MGVKYFGAAVKRREDPRFLRGEARYVEDVVLPGMLRAAFVRSPHAHARIASIRTDAAKAMPGVAVFTHADLERWMKPLPLFGAVPLGLAAAIKFDVRQAPQYALCRDRARHVGEIVAMVVADSPARAEDGAECVAIDWEPLPVVTDMIRGGEPGAPLIHEAWGTNVGLAFTHSFGDPDRAFAGAKGLGEGGAISPPAAIANAVEDALAPFGVKVTRTPLIASRVRALVAEARARGTVPG